MTDSFFCSSAPPAARRCSPAVPTAVLGSQTAVWLLAAGSGFPAVAAAAFHWVTPALPVFPAASDVAVRTQWLLRTHSSIE